MTLTFSTNALPNAIRRFEPMILEWSVKEPGEDTFANFQSTNHNIYTIWGSPNTDESRWGSKLTKKRLSKLCLAANTQNTADKVLSGIHQNLGGSPPNDPPDFENTPYSKECDDWRIMSEVRDAAGVIHTGECHHQAMFLDRCLKIFGHPGGSLDWIFASTDDNPRDEEKKTAAEFGYTVDLDGDGEIGEEIFTLIFHFPNDEVFPNWNNFEGCLVVNGQYYAVWPNIHGVSACNLYGKLTAPRPPQGDGTVGATQHWVLFFPDGTYYEYPGQVPPWPKCR